MKRIITNMTLEALINIVLEQTNIKYDPIGRVNYIEYIHAATLPNVRCYICSEFETCNFDTFANVYKIGTNGKIWFFGCSYFNICHIIY